mgnify:FL=1
MKTTLTILSLIALGIGLYLYLRPEKQMSEERVQEEIQKLMDVPVKIPLEEQSVKIPIEECGTGEKCF